MKPLFYDPDVHYYVAPYNDIIIKYVFEIRGIEYLLDDDQHRPISEAVEECIEHNYGEEYSSPVFQYWAIDYLTYARDLNAYNQFSANGGCNTVKELYEVCKDTISNDSIVSNDSIATSSCLLWHVVHCIGDEF